MASCLLRLFGESANELQNLTLVVADHCSHVSSLFLTKANI
jgi:hypothetical protein